MSSNQLYLFKDKRFLPVFIVQLCGCLNDSIIKNALIILVTFKLASTLAIAPYILVMLANVLFVLPFVVFASLAGQLADRFERTTLVKIIKSAEIIIILMAAYGFYHTDLIILFLALTLLGIHSTFFGPIKYSVLPDQLRKEELLSANGYVEAGTFLSILIGTIIGGFYNFNGALIVIFSIMISLIGLGASFFMPASGNTNLDVNINPNIIKETINIVKYAYSRTQVYLSILGISWFWFIGAAIIAQIPLLTRETLGADETVANLFLVMFSVGVGVGSFWCNKFLGNKVTTKYVFISAVGISFFGLDLHFATRIAEINYQPEHLKSIEEFLSKIHYWRILLDLFCLSVTGGLYVVPLYTTMQCFTPSAYRSRVIAANNLINSIFMALSAAVLSLLFYMKFSVPSVILIVSILNLIIAIHIYKFIPNTKILPLKAVQMFFRVLFDLVYGVEVKGIENYKKVGKRAVIVANHLSYIDPLLIGSYIPENIQFAINMTIAKKWWVRPFLKLARTYPIETNNPMAIKSLIEEVRKNKKIAIFPEGRISVTGTLMKIYEGPAMIADKANASILPIRVDGTQFTRFSKVKKRINAKFSFRRKITITILPPVKLNPPSDLNNRERRKYVGQVLYDIMSGMMFDSSNYQETLFQSLVRTAELFDSKKTILEDVDTSDVSYRDIIFKSFLLSNIIAKQKDKNIGLMLPNATASVITFFAMQVASKVPAMINFTAGAKNVISACKTAEVKVIYTSSKFIKKAELEELVSLVSDQGIKFLYLEDVKKEISSWLIVRSFVGASFPRAYYKYVCKNFDHKSAAVILFTSGTEGAPKAVALSHENIQANCFQVLSIIDFTPNYDIAFNALPLFHSFGLTTTLIMIFAGVETFLYPSPLHYKIIPELSYYAGATIMFGTDTFLSNYAENAHPYDFYSMRYVVAGAERLRESTRQIWLDKFGIRILEGYGVTEASPVISVNTPMHYKAGSIGRFLPRIEYFLRPISGISNGGSLCIKGPNVMLGYIKPENPGVIESSYVEGLGNNWYDTGDIASVDNEGYITILGRYKRFAKIAGEMISLKVVEELANQAGEKENSAAICLPDDRKGEKILLFTTNEDLTREILVSRAREMMLSELYIPRVVIIVKEIPVLATGKIDYLKLQGLGKKAAYHEE